MDKSSPLKQVIICAIIPSLLSLSICTFLLNGKADDDARLQQEIAALRQDLHTLQTLSEQYRQSSATQRPALFQLERQLEQLSSRQEQMDAQCRALKTLADTSLNTQTDIQGALHELRVQNAQLVADSQAARENASLPLQQIDELSSKIEQLQMDVSYLYAESNTSRQYLLSLQNLLLRHSGDAHASSESSSSHINLGSKGDLLKAGYKLLRDKGSSILNGVQDFVDQQRADSLSFPAE